MNGFILLIPFLAVRFLLLGACGRQAIPRAAHFAPMCGWERWAYWVYQGANAAFFLCLLILQVWGDHGLRFWIGLLLYGAGLGLCGAAVVSFARPDRTGLNTGGLYRFSRNPMYVAYFLCFLGMVCLTGSLLLLGILLVFQMSAHWIILAEERWCLEQFGPAYEAYRSRVRRYL